MEHGPPNMTVSPTPDHQINDSHNSTENNEDENPFGSLNFYYWMQILSLLIASLGLLGNGVVLWLLGFRIPRTPFSVYILNLAAADALFLCCSFLVSLKRVVNYFYPIMHTIVTYLQFIFYSASLSLLAAISTERCLSALFPIWYRCHRPKHTSAAVCAGLWALAGVFGLMPFVIWEYLFPPCNNLFIFEVGYFLLLTCVMCVSSLTLLLRVQCSFWRRQPPRLYLLVLLIVLMFLLCGLPWVIWDFMYFLLNIYTIPSWPFETLAYVNSSVNPLIYFFVGRLGHKRREPLRLVLQRALGEEQESGGGTTNTPHTSNPETTF